MSENKSTAKDEVKEIKEVKKVIDAYHPLIEHKEVWIKRKENTSAYKTLNRNGFVGNIEKIGASFKGQDTLRGLTPAEEARFLPEIIGVVASADIWYKATKEFWLNISRPVPEEGLKLETGLMYTSNDDYEADKKAERTKEGAIINPKGKPINTADYVLWRYCLVYNKIANTTEDIGKSPNIIFYIYSKEKEIVIKKEAFKAKQNANKLLYANIHDRGWSKWLLRLLIINDNSADKKYTIGMLGYLAEEEVDIALGEYAEKSPSTFLAYGEDKKLELKAFVEECIDLGRLTRIPNTTTIVFENSTIGNSLDQAVAFLSDSKNANVMNTLKAQVKINL